MSAADAPPGRLAGRVGIVTAVDTPLGRLAAEALAAAGMALAVTGASVAVREVAAAAEAVGVPAFPAATDVTDSAAVRRLVAQVEQRLGPVDLLVLAEPADVLVEEVLPALLAARRGRIVLRRVAPPSELAARLAGTGVLPFALPPEPTSPAVLVALAAGDHDDRCGQLVQPRLA